MRRFVWETLRFREGNVECHFSADVKKPDSFESGLLVFGVGALLRSDNAEECLSAHSYGESHITNATLSSSVVFFVFFYPWVSRYSTHATMVRLTQCN
jgi:hypothetical protein